MKCFYEVLRSADATIHELLNGRYGAKRTYAESFTDAEPRHAAPLFEPIPVRALSLGSMYDRW